MFPREDRCFDSRGRMLRLRDSLLLSADIHPLIRGRNLIPITPGFPFPSVRQSRESQIAFP